MVKEEGLDFHSVTSWILYAILGLMLSGCGSIPQDNTPAPIDNNLYTLELASCDKRDVGLMTCSYRESQDLSSRFLEIPLFHEGEFQINSTRCGFERTFRYSDQSTARFSYEELLAGMPSNQSTCTFDVKLFVDDLDRGFRGLFTLTDMEDFQEAEATFLDRVFTGTGHYQTRTNYQGLDFFTFYADYSGTIFGEGCNIDFEFHFTDNPKVKFNEAIASHSCILRIGLIPDDPNLPVEFFTFSYQAFSTDVARLAQPVLEWDGKRLRVTGDSLVAVIAIDNEYKVFKGRSNKRLRERVSGAVWVRMATSNGRFDLYRVDEGEVTWNTSIRW